MDEKTKKALEDCHLDHVAVAVSDLEVAVQTWEKIGLHFDDKREVVKDQSVVTAFAHLDVNAHLELLMPLDGQGPIQKYIEKKGQGIHHLCFRVKDVKKKAKELKDLGFQLIYEEERIGANNCLVNFIHPASTGGVLVEISQKM
jgi:methylmalonyl-CoA/ethylmalonyl-CoA epimerase